MKKIKTLIIIAIITLIILIAGITCYVLANIDNNIPEEIKNKCETKQEKYKDRNIFILKSKEKQPTNTKILYLHGGSYMAEPSPNHWDFVSDLANETGATVIMPDYPLTPNHNYKDVFEIMIPLYKELINQISTENLIIMGDSAGGGLGLALEEKLGEENISMPSKTILISPWLDVRLENPEIDEVQKEDKMLNKEILKLAGILYAAGDIDSYLVNPIDGDLSKLKNVTILTGTDDILNPDVKVLKEKAEKQGVRRTNTNKRI